MSLWVKIVVILWIFSDQHFYLFNCAAEISFLFRIWKVENSQTKPILLFSSTCHYYDEIVSLITGYGFLQEELDYYSETWHNIHLPFFLGLPHLKFHFVTDANKREVVDYINIVDKRWCCNCSTFFIIELVPKIESR